MSISTNVKEDINNIDSILNEKKSPLLKNSNIFNISFEDDDKSNKYLKYFLSNEDIFDKDIDIYLENINDEKEEINSISEEFNQKYKINAEKNENCENYIEELLNILKKPLTYKNIRFYNSPFKPLLKPKNVSMEGKIIYKSNNINEISCNNTTENLIM